MMMMVMMMMMESGDDDGDGQLQALRVVPPDRQLVDEELVTR